jgi:hypothetical protein
LHGYIDAVLTKLAVQQKAITDMKSRIAISKTIHRNNSGTGLKANMSSNQDRVEKWTY